ncbi:MAG: hypothetical protein WKG01_10315 [Kofleriaceae bacterium]
MIRTWLVLAIVIVAVPLRVAADPAAADRAAAEAEALAQAGEFANAAAKFREAYRADPRPDLYCNIGITTYKANQPAPAHLLLARCLDRASLEPQFVEAARAVLASIETTLRAGEFTPVEFSVEPSASAVTIEGFGSDEAFVGSRVVWLPFGRHRVTVHAEGHTDRTVEIVTSSRAQQTQRIKLEKQIEKPLPAATTLREGSRSKLPAIATSAVTVLAIVGIVVSYSKAHSRSDVADFALDTMTYESDRDVIEKWNTRLAISSVVAVLGAGASGILWYRALTPPQIEVRAEGGATISFGGRF